MKTRTLGAILGESVLLAFVIMGVGFSFAVLWHARTGAPLALRGPAPERELASVASRIAFDPPALRPADGQELPASVLISVPFTPQSPDSKWNAPFNAASEESAVVMAMAWVLGDQTLAPDVVSDEIRSIVAYEDYTFGYYTESTARETAQLITHFYGWPRAAVREDVSADSIKRELAAGNIVIAPVMGEKLLNPHYQTPPAYHTLIIVGYDDSSLEFIVHDPGTRRGRNFRYPVARLMGAIHDWNGSADTLESAPQRMIVVARGDNLETGIAPN